MDEVKAVNSPGVDNLQARLLIDTESERVQTEYRRRQREIGADVYAPWQPAEMFMRTGRTRIAVAMLRQAGAFPQAGEPCLEIGYGALGWLATLLSWGVRETDLHGIEIDPRRAALVQKALPMADLRVGNAMALPWPDGAFRLAVASVMFTSILDDKVRRLVAGEIARVLAPGGALVWYDFAVNNPRNPGVRKVSRKELRALFPQLQGSIRSATLATPLARLVTPRSGFTNSNGRN